MEQAESGAPSEKPPTLLRVNIVRSRTFRVKPGVHRSLNKVDSLVEDRRKERKKCKGSPWEKPPTLLRVNIVRGRTSRVKPGVHRSLNKSLLNSQRH